MPRKGKGPGGSPGGQQTGGPDAQPLPDLQGAPYGAETAARDSARAIPIPQVGGPPGGAASAGGAPPAGPGGDPLAAALAAMSRAPSTPPLYGESQRPDEPLTAGMSMGAGPGPEVLRNGGRATRTYRQLAQITGNPAFSRLAELAASRGR